MILAIDPGTEISAYVVWDGTRVIDYDMLPNDGLLEGLHSWHGINNVIIEGVACYGMPVGREVFSTCIWIGRFWQATVYAGMTAQLVYRQEIKLHHCGSARAKDSNVRQALLDKYGPQGTKKEPGVTHGLSKHLWSAFAIATWYTETKQSRSQELLKPNKPLLMKWTKSLTPFVNQRTTHDKRHHPIGHHANQLGYD